MKKEHLIIFLIVTNFICAWFWYVNKKEASLQKELAIKFEQIAQENARKAELAAAEAQRQMMEAHRQRQLAEQNALAMIDQLKRAQGKK